MMTRSAKLAATGSCVTMTIVVSNDLFISSKRCNKSFALFESSAPVGSSANMICGL